jgi:hypothetical protein
VQNQGNRGRQTKLHQTHGLELYFMLGFSKFGDQQSYYSDQIKASAVRSKAVHRLENEKSKIR